METQWETISHGRNVMMIFPAYFSTGAPRQPSWACVRGSRAGRESEKSSITGLKRPCSAGAVTLTRDSATRAPVKYRVAETGAYMPRPRPRHSTRRSQKPERLERKGTKRWPDLEALRRVQGLCGESLGLVRFFKRFRDVEKMGLLVTVSQTTNRWTRGVKTRQMFFLLSFRFCMHVQITFDNLLHFLEKYGWVRGMYNIKGLKG